jgi:hypothetical protein
MSKPLPELNSSSASVFTEVRLHKAMPLYEIAATTGIRGDELYVTVQDLAKRNLVTIKEANDPADAIVSVSGSYY